MPGRPADGAGAGPEQHGGLDEVLVAAELALERAGPGGRISPEHVANVLARLTAPERPPNVTTSLSTTTPPQADPAATTDCAA
jgi:hypothetical protein